jgi:hypothetical protein
MEIKEQVSEDEVIAEFLKGEINSKRFGKKILDILTKDKKEERILLNPNLENKKENLYRRKLLSKTRGFGKDKEIFENFPKDIIWKKAVFSKKELEKVKYIDYSYWNEISNKSRLPKEAAKKINKGEKVYDVSNDGFFEILSVIKQKIKFPKMIFVTKNKKSRVVVLEGHARLTAYFLAPRYIPKEIEVIIGFSEKIKDWDLY